MTIYKKRAGKVLIVFSMMCALSLVSLALIPHKTCACPQYEDGSQLTNLINKVSERVFGKPLIKRKPNPYQ